MKSSLQKIAVVISSFLCITIFSAMINKIVTPPIAYAKYICCEAAPQGGCLRGETWDDKCTNSSCGAGVCQGQPSDSGPGDNGSSPGNNNPPAPTNTPVPTPTQTPTPTSTPTPVQSPTPTPLPQSADVDRNGCIGIADYNIWRTSYVNNGIRRTGTFPDMNNDGSVDLADFNYWFNAMLTASNICS